MTEKEWSTFHDPNVPSLFDSELYWKWFFDKCFQIRNTRLEEQWYNQKEIEIAAAKRAFESILNGYAK